MSRDLNEISDRRIQAAIMLSDSGKYADALILLLEAVNVKMNAVYLTASLREGFEAEAPAGYKQFFSGNTFFRKDFAVVCGRIEDSIARSKCAQHRVLRKKFIELLEDIKLLFQDADRYAAGRKSLSRPDPEHTGGAGLAVELLTLADIKLDSATLLFDAKKYDECLIILCAALEIKLKSLVLSCLGHLPGGDVFALFAEHFPPEGPSFLKGDFIPLVRQVESLCAAPSVERTIDRTACLKLLDDIALFFREANKAVKKLPQNMHNTASARLRSAAPWLAGMVVLAVATLLATCFSRKPDGSGLTGTYYSGTDLTPDHIVFQRKDPAVDFNWTRNPPAPRMPASQYSVRWSGKFYATKDRDYNFFTTSDDGARLWINNTLIIDNWQVQGAADSTGKIFLKKGWHDIRLDYFQNQGDAIIQLLWDGSFLTNKVIPAEYFKP